MWRRKRSFESLEGKKGQPRLKPPFPAQFGLFGRPTTINNVETIASVATIVRKGAGWFSSFGRDNNKGTKLFCFSGHVSTPCVIEAPLGERFIDMVEEYAGGFLGGIENFLAVIPGGSSVPVVPHKEAEDLVMDYDGCQQKQSALGSGAVIVMNKQTDIVAAIARLSRFYHHESCGQCTPCREGTGWLAQILSRWEKGVGDSDEIEMVNHIIGSMSGNTICALADAAVWPIQGLLRHFRPEVENRFTNTENKRDLNPLIYTL